MKQTPLPFDPDDDDSVAAYFDTHSGDELEWEEVALEPELPLRRLIVPDEEAARMLKESEFAAYGELESLTIHLTNDDLARLKRLADKHGIERSTMARLLIHRDLQRAEG